jgi:hypothetical protein
MYWLEHDPIAVRAAELGARPHYCKQNGLTEVDFAVQMTDVFKYGAPQLHPQPETYWGHVKPVGLRDLNDEAKRFAEALTTAYQTYGGVHTTVLSVFNPFSPRMRPNDGRALPRFQQGIRGELLTVAGDGVQARSVCYVDELVKGAFRLLVSNHPGPGSVGEPGGAYGAGLWRAHDRPDRLVAPDRVPARRTTRWCASPTSPAPARFRGRSRASTSCRAEAHDRVVPRAPRGGRTLNRRGNVSTPRGKRV